jgi:hypothetical protein
MADITGTNGNNTFTIIQGGTYSVDGLAGIDTIDFGSDPLSRYEITLGKDGLVHVDSISGASETLRMTLKNFEVLLFSYKEERVDLTTFFGDSVAPTLLSSTPGNQADGVAGNSNIVLSFSEPVVKGSGTLAVRDAAGNLVASWDIAGSAEITVDGSTLVLNPSVDLPFGQSLRFELPAGAVKDSSGNVLDSTASFAFSTAPDPRYTGTAGNDVFSASVGQHSVSGGDGIDTLVLGQARAAFVVQHTGAGFNVNGGTSAEGYALTAVERLHFSDTHLALDLDGHAGQTAKVLGAVFGAAAVANVEYAGIGLELLDSGTSYEALMKLALDVALGANASHGAVVDLLYLNVVGVAPDTAIRASYVALLDSGSYTPASLGVLAADTSFNAAHINLVGLADSGLPYIG